MFSSLVPSASQFLHVTRAHGRFPSRIQNSIVRRASSSVFVIYECMHRCRWSSTHFPSSQVTSIPTVQVKFLDTRTGHDPTVVYSCVMTLAPVPAACWHSNLIQASDTTVCLYTPVRRPSACSSNLKFDISSSDERGICASFRIHSYRRHRNIQISSGG